MGILNGNFMPTTAAKANIRDTFCHEVCFDNAIWIRSCEQELLDDCGHLIFACVSDYGPSQCSGPVLFAFELEARRTGRTNTASKKQIQKVGHLLIYSDDQSGMSEPSVTNISSLS